MFAKLQMLLKNKLFCKISVNILFWIFAILPLITSDIVLRYVLNPIYTPNIYSIVPILFNMFWIFMIIYICRYVLPKKIGRIVYVIFTSLFGIWFFANFISFKMFGRFLWFESIFLAGEATDYLSVVGQYINIKVILVTIIYLGSISITCIIWPNGRIKNRIKRVAPIALSILGVIGVNTFMNISIAKDKEVGAWEVWDKPTLIYDKFVDSNKSLNVAGLYQYTFKSIYKTFANESLISPEKEAEVDSFFEEKSVSEDNEMTGLLKDKNIIFVLMESIDNWMITDKYMPTLKYMMENGINFTNHYMPNVGMGYTFNAEFAANTGYYCPTIETSASIYTKNSFPFAFANMANREGYVGTTFHYNSRTAVMHRQFGYKDYKSFMNYLSIEKCVQDSEAAKSDKIYGMMTENEKFLDFIITYSAHLPYDKEDNKLKGALANYPELIDESLDLETKNALLLAHDTDEFFRILLDRLKEDNLLENTVIIGFTDHYSYGISSKEKVLELRGNPENKILEKTPFFIYCPGIKPVEVTKVTSSIDILPTLVNILGFEKCNYYLGNDAFDDKYNGLVYFPNGNWYDGNIYYNSNDTYSEKDSEYIDNTNKYIAKLMDTNDYVISTDYFSRLNRKANKKEKGEVMETGHFSKFERAVETNNKRAVKSGAIAALTLEEFETAYIYFGGKCAYSGKTFSSDSAISIEHIIPIMSGGHSMAFNCIPVIGNYNSSKSGYHLLDWWKCQSDGMSRSLYNPYRLLKVLNYMVKCLEAIEHDDPTVHILTDNEIDTFLSQHKRELESSTHRPNKKNGFKKISQLEVLTKMDMIKIEDLYSVYSELDNIKLNTAIFFEETIHELEDGIPKEVLDAISNRINSLPDIYIDGKKVFKKEMNPEDIQIRKAVLAWAEKEGLENKYGIIGYMDFEVLKLHPNVTEFFEMRKQLILEKIGVVPGDFNNMINKVPNILTDLNVEHRISELSLHFGMNTDIKDGKSSELYRYIIGKPDLLLAGENMEILLKYVEELKIDKRLLRKGVPITTIIDNIEMAIELVKLAELEADDKTKRRVLDKLINGTTGNLLRDAYREFRKNVKEKHEEISVEQIKRDAARWIICISEKYNASEILRPKRIAKTSSLYDNMSFDAEGFMKGINPNAYIVPKIVSLAELDISREAEAEIINNVFFAGQIRRGMRADIVLRELGQSIKKDNPDITDDNLMKEAARWFVFLSESSQVHLGVMFDKKAKSRYMAITKKYYSQMKFDEKGNFIDQNMPELNNLVIGIDYMRLADSYIKSSGDYYIIKGRYVPKAEIQDKLYARLSKCKNKKAVKAACIRMLKELTGTIGRKGGESIGK